MIPEPVTPPTRDSGHRAQSIYNLEKTLAAFIDKLFTDTYRLDNPTLNLAQASVPTQNDQVPTDPDQPPVSYDYTERAQTLALKVPPRVERGRVPRTVTGEVAHDKLPDCPAIIVQAVSSKIDYTEQVVLVKICVSAYDEHPDSGGYQDLQNMIEVMTQNLASYGQKGIDQAYPIVLPMEWKLNETDTFPHFIAEITCHWQMATTRPLPDPDVIGMVPFEGAEFHLENRR